MKARYLGFAALAAIVLLSPRGSVEACGPWFEPDVFVNTVTPDDQAVFAHGDLGILQAGFDSNEYAVAYRYLNGGKLSDAEIHAYAPPSGIPETGADYRGMNPDQIYAAQQAELRARKDAQPVGQWLSERAKYAPALASADQKIAFPTDFEGNIVFDENYLNCPDPAFVNATLTLGTRAATWGTKSPWVTDWIHAQDAVFSNCAGKISSLPSAALSDSPALLKEDRAYQIASASFYAKQFDDAEREFEAIAHDSASPWQRWGTYLAARANVRKAFAMGKATDPYSGDVASFDMDTMKHAQQMLESLLQQQQPGPQPSSTVIQSELNFIRIRTEPDKRLSEISIALAGPAPDPNFAQDMRDLSWTLSKHIDISNPSPLLSWIEGWRGAGTAATAFSVWQRTGGMPWLTMAMVKASPSDPFVSDLLAAAAKIEPVTPAYDTVFFHRVRVLIALQRNDEARSLLDAAIPPLRNQKPSSYLNALLGERMAVARNFSEFLSFAPRAILRSGSQGADDLQGLCNVHAHAQNGPADCPGLKQPFEFDNDAITALNQQLPIQLLVEAASSPTLPQNLRQNIALAAWTRAVLLEDAESAGKLSGLLPKELLDTRGDSIGFPADLAILRNPGIRPYLESGIPRVASFSYFDEFRNNWWCKPWAPSQEEDNQKPKQLLTPSFISASEAALGHAQYEHLQQLSASIAIIGQRVVDYATSHPDDALVPEALALTVRATHYACPTYVPNARADSSSEYTPVSKAAFQLLHRRYPNSSWTKKTPYYY
jgi:tetratricopeptide (TPR) repeat protein